MSSYNRKSYAMRIVDVRLLFCVYLEMKVRLRGVSRNFLFFLQYMYISINNGCIHRISLNRQLGMLSNDIGLPVHHYTCAACGSHLCIRHY